jgi:hypothetical protein
MPPVVPEPGANDAAVTYAPEPPAIPHQYFYSVVYFSPARIEHLPFWFGVPPVRLLMIDELEEDVRIDPPQHGFYMAQDLTTYEWGWAPPVDMRNINSTYGQEHVWRMKLAYPPY